MSLFSNTVLASFAATAALLGAPQSASAQTYTLQVLAPFGKLAYAWPEAIDEAGVASGAGRRKNESMYYPVLWTNGRAKVLKNPEQWSFDMARLSAQNNYMVAYAYDRSLSVLWRPDGSITPFASFAPAGEPCGCMALDVDSQGHAVGLAYKNGVQQPVLWTDPALPPTVLPAPAGVSFPEAYRTAANGWVIGFGFGSDGYYSTMVWKDGQLQDMSALSGLTGSIFDDINDHGTAAGSYIDFGRDTEMPMLWKAGQLELLATAQYQGCSVSAINNLDLPVGSCDGRAVIWKDGVPTLLTSLLSADTQAAGWVVELTLAINDQGDILAQVRNTTRQNQDSETYAVLKPISNAGARRLTR
ncbi:hypothetical protein LRH25_23815 [Ideonella azotifigens]|uniref:Uncharacterized protein n=1 Tax=Ideonella azotifigens TaxID=513160 RepID=A0ABN1KM11_9BURK|nr:hypothetical protein [Ideonella azotifigens]MCD2343359.1 hypothetical protein [Ideonella azotifigens]